MSGLRCKPGDLAQFIVAPKLNPAVNGLLVDVLYAAPCELFVLPSGTLQSPAPTAGWWVVKFIGTEPFVPWGVPGRYNEMRRQTHTIAPDWALRPIRPGADEPATETTREKEAA